MTGTWRKKRLQDVCLKITDGTHKTPIYKSDGIIFLSARNIRNGSLDLSEHKYISAEEHQQLIKRCNPETGDVLLSKSGSLGDSIVIPELPFQFSIFESLALLKINHKFLRPEFLQQYLDSPSSQKYFESITSGIAVKHLHLIDLKEMPIPIPSLPEQRKISNILRTWDKAIEKIDALITKKENLFRWLQIRLIVCNPDNSEWNKKHLGQLLDIKKGEQLNRTELEKKGQYPAWNGGIAPSGYTDVWNTPENTVTISEGGNSCGFVNYCIEKFWCGGHCYALLQLNSNIHVKFLFYYLKAHEMHIMRLRVGSGLPNIQRKDIENFKIQYPNIETQQEIVRVLSVARHEIDTLKRQKDALKTQKCGLMQKLLTGAWPVTVSDKEAA